MKLVELKVPGSGTPEAVPPTQEVERWEWVWFDVIEGTEAQVDFHGSRTPFDESSFRVDRDGVPKLTRFWTRGGYPYDVRRPDGQPADPVIVIKGIALLGLFYPILALFGYRPKNKVSRD